MKRKTILGRCYQLVVLFSLVFSNQLIAQGSPEDFATFPKYNDVQISPDGKYLAVTVDVEGKNSLVFLDSKTYQVVSRSSFPKREEVGDVSCEYGQA